MNLLKDKILMVLDTEYDTNPKRILSLAYIIYENDSKTKKVLYVKHDPDVFKVNEYGEAFKYHKLTNNFLNENGKSLTDVLMEFYTDLENVNVLVGQNIMAADIHMIRKESIGLNMWFGIIRDKLKNIEIFDTMKAFKNVHRDKSASLDNIYKFLMGKEMKDHHKALDDCKNTYKCFKVMRSDNKYTFKNEKINFSEDILDQLTSVKKQCNLCKNKMLVDDNGYLLKNVNVEINNKKISILNSNFLQAEKEICKRCLNNLELLIFNKDDKLKDIVKLKVYEEYINKFFEITGVIKRKIYLNCSYNDKNEIKKLGGRWDGLKRRWYCVVSDEDDINIKKFNKWLPKKSIII